MFWIPWIQLKLHSKVWILNYILWSGILWPFRSQSYWLILSWILPFQVFVAEGVFFFFLFWLWVSEVFFLWKLLISAPQINPSFDWIIAEKDKRSNPLLLFIVYRYSNCGLMYIYCCWPVLNLCFVFWQDRTQCLLLPVCKINVKIVHVEVVLCQLVVLNVAECKYKPMLMRCKLTGLGIQTHCIDNTLFFS